MDMKKKKPINELDYRDVLRALSKNYPKDAKRSVMYTHRKISETIEVSSKLADKGQYIILSPQGNKPLTIDIPPKEKGTSFYSSSNLSTLSLWMSNTEEDSGIRSTSINPYVLSSTLTTLLLDDVKFHAFKSYILDSYEDIADTPFLSVNKYKATFIQKICEYVCQNLSSTLSTEKNHSLSSASPYSFEALEELLFLNSFVRVRSPRKNEITWHSSNSNIIYQLLRSDSFIDSLIKVKSSVENLIHIYNRISKFPFAEGQINTDISDHSMNLDISMCRSSYLSYENEITLLNAILETIDPLCVAYKDFSNDLDPDLGSNTFDTYDKSKMIFVALPEAQINEYRLQVNHFDYEYRYGKSVMSELKIPLAITFSGSCVSDLTFDINVSLPIKWESLFFKYLCFLDEDLETYRFFSRKTGFSHSKMEQPDKATRITYFSTRLILDNDIPHIILSAQEINHENQTRAIQSMIKFIGNITRCIDNDSVPTICLEQLRSISRVQKQNRYKSVSSEFEASFLYSEVFKRQELYKRKGYKDRRDKRRVADWVVEKSVIAYTKCEMLSVPIHIRFSDNRIVKLYGYYGNTEVSLIEKEYQTFEDILHIINGLTSNESYSVYCSMMKAHNDSPQNLFIQSALNNPIDDNTTVLG